MYTLNRAISKCPKLLECESDATRQHKRNSGRDKVMKSDVFGENKQDSQVGDCADAASDEVSADRLDNHAVFYKKSTE